MGVEPPYVDYDSFELDPAVSGADFSIFAYMLSRYFSAHRATRPARSCASTAAQVPPSAVLAPHGFATLPEAQAFIASRGDSAVSSTYFRMRGNPRASTGDRK
jgi:hypothetical protein